MDHDQFNMFMGKYGIGIILLGMVIIIAILKPMFIKPGNLLNIFTQISINGLIAYGMCLAITTGGIDLSVGAQLALVSCILGQLVGVRGMNLGLAILIAVLVAGLFGFLNGVLISKFDMFPFVVTLSMQLIIRSIAQIISEGKAVSMAENSFKAIYSGKFGPIPRPIIYLAVVVIIMYIVMHWTRFGRYVYAVGGNVNAAIASGVSVFWTKTLCYTISGVLAGLAGALYSHNYATLQAAKFDYNMSILILVFVVLGGIGNIRGSVIAAIVLTLLPEVLRSINNYRMLIYSIVLIVMMICTSNEKASNLIISVFNWLKDQIIKLKNMIIKPKTKEVK